MAQIVLDIPTGQTNRVINAFSAEYGFPQAAREGETKTQFCKRMLAQIIKNAVKRQEVASAVSGAAVAAEEKVDTEVVIS